MHQWPKLNKICKSMGTFTLFFILVLVPRNEKKPWFTLSNELNPDPHRTGNRYTATQYPVTHLKGLLKTELSNFIPATFSDSCRKEGLGRRRPPAAPPPLKGLASTTGGAAAGSAFGSRSSFTFFLSSELSLLSAASLSESLPET